MIDVDGPIEAAKRDAAMTSLQLMTGRLKAHAGYAGLAAKAYTMHSFRVGYAVSQALHGRALFDEIMQRVF